MAWLCIFFPHRWRHVSMGLWQCTRCKELSVGRDPTQPELDEIIEAHQKT